MRKLRTEYTYSWEVAYKRHMALMRLRLLLLVVMLLGMVAMVLGG